MKKPGSYHFNQVIKVNITSNWAYWYHVLPHMLRWEEDITSLASFPQIHNCNLSMKKHQRNPNWEAFYKHLTNILQEYQGHERQEKAEELSQVTED